LFKISFKFLIVKTSDGRPRRFVHFNRINWLKLCVIQFTKTKQNRRCLLSLVKTKNNDFQKMSFLDNHSVFEEQIAQFSKNDENGKIIFFVKIVSFSSEKWWKFEKGDFLVEKERFSWEISQ
jgi:hypothetical protein